MTALATRHGWIPPVSDAECVVDQYWRLTTLYSIVNEHGLAVPFRLRPVQDEFYWSAWYLNLVLKSRQHGFTTFCCIWGLDAALWNENYHFHVIADTRENAEMIFDTKIKFPYEHMADGGQIKGILSVETDNTRILKFANGSTVSCGQSMRSGTVQRLHISEYGRLCAAFPDKAREIQAGALNTVHAGNMITIESTARGRTGDFYQKVQEARKNTATKGRKLSKLEFKFFFFPWYRDAKNVLCPTEITLTRDDQKYFRELARENKITLTPGQQAWYAAKARQNRDLIFQEHPSTPDEAFYATQERKIFGKQMLRARRDGRIVPFIPFEPRFPVDTTWDIGKNDEMAIWWHQYIVRTGQHRWLLYFEDNGYSWPHYVNELYRVREEFGIVYGKHYMPHDIEHTELSLERGKVRKDILHDLGMRNMVTVERVPFVMHGNDAARLIIETSWFSEAGCEKGILHLENYQLEIDPKTESARDTPKHDAASNGADAFRQLCQAWESETAYKERRHQPVSWKTR